MGLEALCVTDVAAEAMTLGHFDVGVWAAGYEQRAGWFIQSKLAPAGVERWYRAEFLENDQSLDGPRNRAVEIGEPFGGAPGHTEHDGHWIEVWNSVIDHHFRTDHAPVDILIDYSSMPRTVYGTALVEACGRSRHKVRSITFVYVPGVHGADIDGARRLVGLRSLIGLEGAPSMVGRDVAVVLGIGYEGTLAEALIDTFEIDKFSCFVGGKGSKSKSLQRSLDANVSVTRLAERVLATPIRSVAQTMSVIQKLCSWYAGRKTTMLVPIGPKSHVLSAMLVALESREVGFRWPRTLRTRPTQVGVGSKPKLCVTRVEFK